MTNIVTTIPKSRFPDWQKAEAECLICDGETIHPGYGYAPFWTVRCQRGPTKPIVGGQCYMIFDGRIRGYFDIVDIDDVKNWSFHTPTKAGSVIVLANWHPVSGGPEMVGFQGWRYSALRL